MSHPVTLAELYRKIPGIPCKGLCVKACGPVAVGAAEARAMTAAGGPFTVDPSNGACGYLDHGRCRIYSHRPFICRLFGVEETLLCPFGCTPDRLLPHTEGAALFDQLKMMAGRPVWPTYEKDGVTREYRP